MQLLWHDGWRARKQFSRASLRGRLRGRLSRSLRGPRTRANWSCRLSAISVSAIYRTRCTQTFRTLITRTWKPRWPDDEATPVRVAIRAGFLGGRHLGIPSGNENRPEGDGRWKARRFERPRLDEGSARRDGSGNAHRLSDCVRQSLVVSGQLAPAVICRRCASDVPRQRVGTLLMPASG